MKMKFPAGLKLVLAMLIWGTLALFVRGVHFPSAEIVLARIVFGLLFLGGVLLLRRRGEVQADKRAALKHALPRLLLNGAAMGLNWVALFEAYRWVDVSIATLCYYTAPVFAMLGSALFFRERPGARRILGCAAAVAGMLILSNVVPGGENPLRGALLGLVSAVLYASVTLSSKCVRGLDGLTITTAQLFGALIVILPYALITHSGAWRMPETGEWLRMIALGAVHTGLALGLYFSAIQALPVGRVALLSYIDPLSALGFAALFLGERLSPLQLAGAALILGGALLGETGGRKKSENS